MFFRMCAFLCAFCMIMSACSDSDDEIIPQPGDSEGEYLPCVCPDFLKPGDSIAIVSPAYWTDMETIELGMSAIEAMGFTPVLAGINMPLVMGAEAILVAEDNKASLKFAR